MKTRQLKLILLFRSGPNDDLKLRELLERFGLIKRFTPMWRAAESSSEARKQRSGYKGDETKRSLN
jgi:phage gp16-like protein